MKRHRLKAMAAVIGGISALGIVAVAFAFPTSAQTYPSYDGCYGVTEALGTYDSGSERVRVVTQDSNGCADVVWARACVFTNPGTACGSWDADGSIAIEFQYSPDFYYGYGFGQVETGMILTTPAVHP
jgi:hypothetical protein